MQPCWQSQLRKCLLFYVSHFNVGKSKNITNRVELIFRANHSMDAPSKAARGLGKTGMWYHVTGMPSISTTVCDFVFIIALLLFQEAAFGTVHFQQMLYHFGIQSTMQGEGWPIVMSNSLLCCWCLTVWSSVATGLPRPGCPANLCWATGPLKAGWNLLIHIRNISHITCIFDMILSIWYHQNLLGDSWHLGTSSSTDHFKDLTSQQRSVSQF